MASGDPEGMSMVDPDSPRIVGVDVNGKPARLGEVDSDGEFVGYISAEGNCYASRVEHDRAHGGGYLWEAFASWNRTGGALGPVPDPIAVFDAAGVLPENRGEALEEFGRNLELYAMAVTVRAERARLN